MASDTGLDLVYTRLSQARLETAGLLVQEQPDCHTILSEDALIARCNIAMLVWSAAVDAGSALMIQEDNLIPSGNSSEITSYIVRTMAARRPDLSLPFLWRRLVQLQNVQHRADHPLERFSLACTSSYDAFGAFNQLLAPTNRLSPESFRWLERIG